MFYLNNFCAWGDVLPDGDPVLLLVEQRLVVVHVHHVDHHLRESTKIKIVFGGGTKYLEKAKLALIFYLCCGRLAAAPNLLSDHLGKSKVSSQEGCVLNFENAKLKFKQVQSSNLCD